MAIYRERWIKNWQTCIELESQIEIKSKFMRFSYLKLQMRFIYIRKINFSLVRRRLGLLSAQSCKSTGNLQSTTGTELTLDRPCTSAVGKLLFPHSEEGWVCCTPNVMQTLVF